MTDRSTRADSAEFDEQWRSYWLPLQTVGPLTSTRYRLLMAELPRSLPRGTRVIDVGCGPGAFLARIAKRYPGVELYGVEFSTTAWQHAPDALRPRIVVGDILEVAPQLPGHSFDVIVCSEVLEHVADPNAVIGALATLAKPGAILLFSVPAGMKNWSPQDDAAGHLRRFETDEFRLAIEKANLRVDAIYTWGGPLGRLYNLAIDRIGPARAANSSNSRLGRAASTFIKHALRIDDFWPTTRGFQLIVRAQNVAPAQ